MMLVHVAPVHEVLRPLSVIQMGVEEGLADVEQHAAVTEEGTEDRGHAGPPVEGVEAVVLKLAPEEGAAERGHAEAREEGAEAVVLNVARLCATTVVSLATWPGSA